MAIDSRIPLQVQTPQFAPTLSNLVRARKQDEQNTIQNQQRDRQLDLQERGVAAQESRLNAPQAPSEADIGRAYISSAFDAEAASELITQGNPREGLRLLMVAEERLNKLGQDTTGFQEVLRLASADPQGAATYINEHITPRLESLMSGEMGQEAEQRDIVGYVENGKVRSLQTDKQGNFFDMQNNKVELPADAQIVESVSLNAANAKDLSDSARDKLAESEIATKQFIATTGDMVTLLRQNQDINTAVAGAASIVNGLRQEAEAIGRVMPGFDVGQLDPEKYDFSGLGDLNARAKSLITSLAYTRARINDPGGRLSERDVQAAIQEIGGNLSDPESFEGVLRDVAGRAARDFKIRYSTLLNEPFEGDLGMGALNPQEQQQTDPSQLSDEELLNF